MRVSVFVCLFYSLIVHFCQGQGGGQMAQQSRKGTELNIRRLDLRHGSMRQFGILSQLHTLFLFEFYLLCRGKENDENVCLVGTL